MAFAAEDGHRVRLAACTTAAVAAGDAEINGSRFLCVLDSFTRSSTFHFVSIDLSVTVSLFIGIPFMIRLLKTIATLNSTKG